MTDKKLIPNKMKDGLVPVPERLKVFNETEHFGVLATNDNGQPYTSLISFAITPDLKKVIFATPKKTRKFKNILNTKNVSILIDSRSNVRNNLMTTEAITIIGKARHVRKGKSWNELSVIFLEKHPELEEFVQSDTTALIVVTATRCIHVSKFQTISVWENDSIG
jgi:uncharacterized pyridoxamine 5'-phosphate oxidase family protein